MIKTGDTSRYKLGTLEIHLSLEVLWSSDVIVQVLIRKSFSKSLVKRTN